MPLQAMWSTPRGRRVVMDFRDRTNDWNTITSIMAEHDEYGLAEYEITGVAWDIGAYLGGVTVALLADNADLRVVAVEPVKENARLLWANCWHNGLTHRVTIVEGAAGPPGMTETKLHAGFRGSEHAEHHGFVGTTEVGNRYVTEAWRDSADHDIVSVPCYDFAALVAMAGEPSFIKIDCEGAEYAFLDNPGVANVPLIVGEWHNVPFNDRERSSRQDLLDLLPGHDVTFSGPEDGPGGFMAIRRGA